MYLLITAFLSLGSGAGILFQDAGKSVEAYGAHAAWLQEFARAVHNARKTVPHGRVELRRFDDTFKTLSTIPTR
jgi:hypothetical protein